MPRQRLSQTYVGFKDHNHGDFLPRQNYTCTSLVPLAFSCWNKAAILACSSFVPTGGSTLAASQSQSLCLPYQISDHVGALDIIIHVAPASTRPSRQSYIPPRALSTIEASGRLNTPFTRLQHRRIRLRFARRIMMPASQPRCFRSPFLPPSMTGCSAGAHPHSRHGC